MSSRDPAGRWARSLRPNRRRTRMLILFLLVAVLLILLVSIAISHRQDGSANVEGNAHWFGTGVGDEWSWEWVPSFKLPGSSAGSGTCTMADAAFGGGRYDVWNRTVVNSPVTTSFRGASSTSTRPCSDAHGTERLADALLTDERYITAFMIAANDVMAAMDLIYLSLLTNRIPILPPFWPTHVGEAAGLASFSEFFDVTLWSKSLNIPMVEWKDVKNFTQPDIDPTQYFNAHYYGGTSEELGCWSLWMTSNARGSGPKEGEVPSALTLDVSWTPVPFDHQIDPTAEEYDFLELVALNDPSERSIAIRAAKESYLDRMQQTIKEAEAKGNRVEEHPPEKIPLPNSLENQMDPDEHLLCFDYLYFSSTHERGEFWFGDSPAWNVVGTHLHFSPRIIELSTALLRKTFGLPPSPSLSTLESSDPSAPTDPLPLPPFISIHIRRNDFTVWCGDVIRSDCLAPLSAYVLRVSEARSELISNLFSSTSTSNSTSNPNPNPTSPSASNPNSSLFPSHSPWKSMTPEEINQMQVIVFTDEPHSTPEDDADYPPGSSEEWWDNVRKLGWKTVRHDLEGTKEEYGAWYPSILDACMMSLGSAFVGTDRSTYSLIAKRRVEDWQEGPARLVKWGYVGADDH